ncbi:MAG: hypothetical protein ACRERC_10380, partial [Candidatus Binatia bacterium]
MQQQTNAASVECGVERARVTAPAQRVAAVVCALAVALALSALTRVEASAVVTIDDLDDHGVPGDPSRCGNGALDPGEECDAPATTCAAPCRRDCTCDFSNCCQCEGACAQAFFCPVECPPIPGGLCARSGVCAVPCPCGATCTTLDGVVGACQAADGATECLCQPERPPLPDDLVALARRLESVPLADDSGDDTPAPTAGDVGRPAVALRRALLELGRLHAAADHRTERPLRRATEAVQDAWHHYAGGSADLAHL